MPRVSSARRHDTSLPFTFREMLVTPVPLGKNERLPARYALEPNESAMKVSPHTGYMYSKTLDLYILTRHVTLEILCLQELNDLNFEKSTHGTQYTFSQGCSGPLCRRARRLDRAEADLLRKTRLIYEQTNTVYQPSKSRYQQLKISVPPYAAVEPLLTAYTVLAYGRRPPTQPTKSESLYLIEPIKANLIRLLSEQYGSDAFGNGQVGQ